MSLDAQTLYQLLPAVHRIRDRALADAQGLDRGPLEELVAVLAAQIAVADAHLEQLYDDLFIETCADWVVPYIGDLIGYESLHAIVPGPNGGPNEQLAGARAEVAHTIALRRRKGTALALEQLARDVTLWDALAVEYFQRLAATQYLNHVRPANTQAPDLRNGGGLEWIGTAFDQTNRTVDVRRVESGRGRHNIPNVGLHLWRIRAYARRDMPAVRDGPRRYRVSPLNHDVTLYNQPLPEAEISHLAAPDNIPWPLTRRRLAENLDLLYGEPSAGSADRPPPSLHLMVDGLAISTARVRVCFLGDDGADWAQTPPPEDSYAIDPVLGRIALPANANDPANVRVTWHEGFSADLGGGEYERDPGLSLDATPVRVPEDQPTISAALTALGGSGVIEITDNGRYEEALAIAVADKGTIEIRARNGRRPTLILANLTVTGGEHAGCTLNGLLITGAPLRVPDDGNNALARLELRHCTLVPGIALATDGSPLQPGTPSLALEIAGLKTDIERCIIGAVRSHARGEVSATDCLIDANASNAVAYANTDGSGSGASVTLDACTVIGKLDATEMQVSNSILLATLGGADPWDSPVRAARRQTGCVRFSWLPFASVVPTRYRCQPTSADVARQIAPGFSSLRYGTPAYGQLTTRTPVEILRGAEDESEMGVFRHLYGPRREINLGIRLAEYLRVGLRAGVFYES